MKIKFVPSPSAFASFDGMHRTCVRFSKKSGKYRCAKYEKASKVGKHPKTCSPGLISRSPGLIRMKPCSGKGRTAAAPKRKHHRRRHRKH